MVDFRPFLDMLEDKETLYCKAVHKCVFINETMAKNTPYIAQNALSLLNTTTNDQLKTLGVKDKITVMMSYKGDVQSHLC